MKAPARRSFTVTLSAPSGQTVLANYATSSGTATSGADFGPELGALIFNPGETVQTIPVRDRERLDL